jgi:hypothetical protein
MRKIKKKYCRYCGLTESQILKRRRETGSRGFCYARGTPKGYHSFRIIYEDEKDEMRQF